MNGKLFKKLKTIGLLGLGLFLVAYVYGASPENGPILPCIFNKLTGYKCPGCGMTRAVHSIMHLKFKAAFEYNKMVFLFPVWYVLRYIQDSKQVDRLFIILVVLYGIIRNMN